jgi:hypothetical protein
MQAYFLQFNTGVNASTFSTAKARFPRQSLGMQRSSIPKKCVAITQLFRLNKVA